MQWRVNIIVCHSKPAAFQTFKVCQYETKQGNRHATKRIIEIGIVEPELPSHPIFHLKPTKENIADIQLLSGQSCFVIGLCAWKQQLTHAHDIHQYDRIMS